MTCVSVLGILWAPSTRLQGIRSPTTFKEVSTLLGCRVYRRGIVSEMLGRQSGMRTLASDFQRLPARQIAALSALATLR